MSASGLLFDLPKCVGCYTCVVACRALSHSPSPTPLVSIVRVETPAAINYVPVPCMGCREEEVMESCDMEEVAAGCPTSAIKYGELSSLSSELKEQADRVFSFTDDARFYYLARSNQEAGEIKAKLVAPEPL